MPTPDDAATLQAYFEGVDQARADADAKWGRDRLPLLVGDELRAKFRRQAASWSIALQEAWAANYLSRDQLEAVTRKAAAMQRAFAALDAAAAEAGHRPIAPWVWEATISDGTVIAVVQTNAEASKVIAEGRYVAVYTLAEVANVIDALPQALQMAKVVFPGAKVLPQSPAGPWKAEGDEIPFGSAA